MSVINLKKNQSIIRIAIFSIITMGLLFIGNNLVMSDNLGDESSFSLVNLDENDAPIASGDSETAYYYNLFTFSDSQFNDGSNDWGDWTPSSSAGKSTIEINTGSDTVEMVVSSQTSGTEDMPLLMFEPEPFYKGKLTIDWRKYGLENGESLSIVYSTDNENWVTLDTCSQTSTTTSQSETYDLDYNDGTFDDDFTIVVILYASKYWDMSNDRGWVESIELETYELICFENTGDIIEHSENQLLTTVVYPEEDNFDNVSLQFRLNNQNLDAEHTVLPFYGNSSDTYQFLIPEGFFIYGDMINYRFNISSSGTDHFTDDGNGDGEVWKFNATDTTAPTYSNPNLETTTVKYYEDAEYTIEWTDENGGSNLSSVFMYVTNESRDATTSDFRISNQTAWSAGIQSGNFSFTIPDYVLTCDDTLHILIRATDGHGLYTDYTTTIFVTDDVSPMYSNMQISHSGKPDFNDTVTVQYTITEPSDASGFDTDGSGVKLRYKLNAEPENNNDYEGTVSITGSVAEDGGTVDFDFAESIYAYGDTVYYWLNIQDAEENQNNSDFDTYHQFYVNDTTAPDILKGSENDIDSNYFGDKILTFDISEPSDASGFNVNSLQFWFKDGDNDFSTGATKVDFSSVSENNYTFIIQKEGNLTSGHTIYYKINGSDLADVKNDFEILGNFLLIDLEAPFINFITELSNVTAAVYDQDINITVESDEVDIYGIGFDAIEIYIKSGSQPIEEGDPLTYRFDYSSNDDNNFTFSIDSSFLNASELLYWSVKANDTSGNIRWYNTSSSIGDFHAPSISFISENSISGSLNYSDYIEVYFDISEPNVASGFHNVGDNLKMYYSIGEPTDEFDGIEIPTTDIISLFGGTYSCLIPESAFAYGERVYFWGNVTDRSGNSANTFSLISPKYIDIVDNIKPDFELQLSGLEGSSYHIGKEIFFTAIEPLDASGMNFATLYYGLENPDVSTNSYNGSVFLPITQHEGGLLSINIPIDATLGNYTKDMYYIITLTDNVGNTNVSDVFHYEIIDGLAPSASEDENNYHDLMNDEFGRLFEALIWDPDFPTSSGISDIKLYYRLDNPSVSSASGEYDGVINPEESIEITAKNYSFYLSYAMTGYWANGTEFYYTFKITDSDGNIRYTDVNMFDVIDPFGKTVLYPISASSTSYDYYYNTEFIDVEFSVEYACEMWYYIDGVDPFPGESKTFGTHLSDTIEFPKEDGLHTITIFYFQERYNVTREFYLDFTSPETPILTSVSKHNAGYVDISWNIIGEEQSLDYYEIWRSEDNGEFVKIQTATTGIRSYLDLQVQTGHEYEYKIISVDRAGNTSEFSNIESIKIPIALWIILVIAGGILLGVGIFIKIGMTVRSKKAMRDITGITGDESSQYELDDEDLSETKTAERKRKRLESENTSSYEDDTIKEEDWQSIDWRKSAPSQSTLFNTPKSLSAPQYWQKNIEDTVEKATQFEMQNNITDALKLYKIALRSAEIKKNPDMELISYLKEKIFTIYSNPMK